jgi:Glycosyl hydrolase family 26
MTAPITTQARTRPRTCSVVLAVAALACLVLPTGTALAKGRQPQPLYWGAQIGSQLTGTPAPWDMSAVEKFQRLARKRLSLISFSAPFADCSPAPCSFGHFPTTPLDNVRAYGAIPVFSWSSEGSTGSAIDPAFQLSRLIAGVYDPYIRSFAEAAKTWGHPFFLRFDWEMNGFWFPWNEGVNGNQAGEYVAAWRHVHDIFTSVGATNVTWVWCPNVDFTRRLTPLRSLYPGSGYVDWTCVDGFNWGGTSNSAGWMSFDSVFRSTYRRIVRIAPRKPMLIGEVASDERGGSKAAWISNLLRVVPSRYRKVHGLIWYEQRNQGMRWPIESSRSARRAFAAGIQRRVYRSSLYASLPDGPVRPSSW